MKLQFDNGKQESESIVRVSVDVVDDQVIKILINDRNVINIWGTYNKKAPNIFVFKEVAKQLGFDLEVN